MWRSVIDWVFEDTYPIGDDTAWCKGNPMIDIEGEEQRREVGLLQATAAILAERDALVDHAKELESRTADPEEMLRLIKTLLPVLDSIERVLDYAREAPPSEELTNWLKSVEGVYYRLVHTLERQGLKALDTLGKLVDLNCQEVVEYIPSVEHGHDTVVSERQRGYRFRGQLVRDARVVVAYNPKDR